MTMQSKPRYAVLFRTHIWDDFVERQYQRLKARVGDGDLYVLLDETNGPVETGKDRVLSHTNQSIMDLGLAKAGSGNFLWYNGDYPLYFFYHHYSDYDYYVMTEYDVTLNENVDDIIGRISAVSADLLSLTKGDPIEEHVVSCSDAYAVGDVTKRLICFAAFSNRAVKRLFDRRLELSRSFAQGTVRHWPFCEVFIPTELRTAGFKLVELSDLGSTAQYDWWPPVLEAELPTLSAHTFIHPVLDESRYVASVLRIWKISDVLNVSSDLMVRLRKVPLAVFAPPLIRTLGFRAKRALRRRFNAAVPG